MSNRILKINGLIKRELNQILLREIEFPQNILVTITRVETSADLREAKIFFSVMPENQSGKVFKILNSQIYQLQQRINKRLRIKLVPKIIFMEETKTAEAGKIEAILENLKKGEK